MPKLKFSPILILLSIGISCASAQIQKEGSIFQCSQLTDLTAMSNCFRTRFSEMHKKASSSNNGYPYNNAPSLPSYLVAERPSNNLATKRFGLHDDSRQQRMQGYYEPTYRNFLDLDTSVKRVAEYRPVFDIYVSPDLFVPSHDPFNNDINTNFYDEPPKTKKQQKLYGQRMYDQPKVRGQSTSSEQKHNKQRYYNDGNKPAKTSYVQEMQYSRSNSYDKDYYVPANSPIMGDIRRSLMDYTGSFDLMDDEPEYQVKESIIKEMGSDFTPFRRTYSKPLPVRNSKRSVNHQ